MPPFEDDDMDQSIWRNLAKGGPIAIIASALLYVFIMDVRADQKQTRSEHSEFRAEAAASERQMRELVEQILRSSERTAYLQRRQCINTAKSEDQRAACAKDRD